MPLHSLVFLKGEWSAFNAIRAARPDASIVWLERENSGLAFPVENCEDNILIQKQDIVSLRIELLRISQRVIAPGNCGYVSGTCLTPVEYQLLPYFMSGISMQVLSRQTRLSVKTLYNYRKNIMVKMGFRRTAFLQLVYEKNQGLVGVSGPDRIYGM
ncbi:transcriptional regulator [Serratia marcescens]|nr:transcriptional regulator [Serratia marcescens]